MNKVILLGRLTKDPEVRYTQEDNPLAVARFTLAVNRRSKDQQKFKKGVSDCGLWQN